MKKNKLDDIKTRTNNITRMQPEYKGLQVNVCIHHDCENYGLSYQLDLSKPAISYQTGSSGKGIEEKATKFRCNCHIKDEKQTYDNKSISKVSYYTDAKYLVDKQTSCRNTACENHMKSIYGNQKQYKKDGKNNNGKQRFRCKSCNTPLTIETGTKIFNKNKKHKTKKSIIDHNKTILKSLFTGSTLVDIAQLNEIGIQTLYDRINFFSKQSQFFNHEYDQKLKNKKRKYVIIDNDAMDLTTNWSLRQPGWTKKNKGKSISRLISTDLNSAFVMAMTHDFDPYIELPDAIRKINTSNKKMAFLAAHTKESRPNLNKKTKKHNLLYDERKYPHWAINYLTYDDINEIPIQKEVLHHKKNMNGVIIQKQYHVMGHLLKIKEATIKCEKVSFITDHMNEIDRIINTLFFDKIKDGSFIAYHLGHQFHGKPTAVKRRRYRYGERIRKLFNKTCNNDPWYRALQKALADYEGTISNTQQIQYLSNNKPKAIKHKYGGPINEGTLLEWKNAYEKELSKIIIKHRYKKVIKILEDENAKKTQADIDKNGGKKRLALVATKDYGQTSIQIPNPSVLKGNPYVKPLTYGKYTIDDYNSDEVVDDLDRICNDIVGASTHSVDNFIGWCRKSNLCKRKIQSGVSQVEKELGGKEAKYSFDKEKAYEVEMLIKIGHIQRFYWNFMKDTKRNYEDESMTPAMRIGLIKKPITFNTFFTRNFFREDPFKK